MLFGVQRIEILGGVFFGVPLEHEDLFELIARLDDSLLFLGCPIELALDHLNFLVVNQILLRSIILLWNDRFFE